MRDADLQQILEDIERIAAEADRLLRAVRRSDPSGHAADPSQQGAAGADRDGTTAQATRAGLHRSPWRTLGIATGLGFLIGCMLIGRRRR